MKASLIVITPCQPLIGAEIGGVDLTRPIAADVADALRAALLKYQVIVLRDQDVTRDQHLEFARVFVRDHEHPFNCQENQARPVPGYPEILNVFADGVTKTAIDIWHSDESFREFPSAISILRSRVTPALGGDTVFSSAVAAYDRLPDDVKQKIRYLKALHGPEYANKRKDVGLADPAKRSQQALDNPPRAQPVVRIHPETGLPALFVNRGYGGPIVGMENEKGEALLTYLYEQFTKPDYQMRLRWTPNTIVAWDNRSVQHYAVYDYHEPRIMERVTVAGDAAAIGFADLERLSPAVETHAAE
jgi:taurine dioxygenase